MAPTLLGPAHVVELGETKFSSTCCTSFARYFTTCGLDSIPNFDGWSEVNGSAIVFSVLGTNVAFPVKTAPLRSTTFMTSVTAVFLFDLTSINIADAFERFPFDGKKESEE